VTHLCRQNTSPRGFSASKFVEHDPLFWTGQRRSASCEAAFRSQAPLLSKVSDEARSDRGLAADGLYERQSNVFVEDRWQRSCS
jgi:hypothetical protein